METHPGSQIARELVADAKRAIAEIAAAEEVLFITRDQILDRAWRLGRILAALKERVGRGNWYIWLAANLPEIGTTERARQVNAARCMALFRDNVDRRNSSAALKVDSIRKFMWGYVPAKERLQLEGDEEIKPGAHHLTFCNEFHRWDSQVRGGHAELYPESFRREIEPVLRRIREILGPDEFTKLTS